MPALPIWLWLLLGGAGVVVVAKALAPSKKINPIPSAMLKQISNLVSFGPPKVGPDEKFVWVDVPSHPHAIEARCEDVPMVGPVCDSVRKTGLPFVIYDESFKFGETDASGLPKTAFGKHVDLSGVEYVFLGGQGARARNLDYAGFFPVTTESGWGDQFVKAMTTHVLPALATIAGVAVGGFGGAAVAAAIVAYSQIAKGSNIDEAVVYAVKERLSSQIERTEFGQAYKSLAANKYTASYVADARMKVEKYYTAKTARDKAVVAFDQGVALGLGKRTQNALIEEVKLRLPTAEAGLWLDRAMAKGATLEDWILVFAGPKGMNLLYRLSILAGEFVEQGEPGGTFRPSGMARLPLPVIGPITFNPLRPYDFRRP